MPRPSEDLKFETLIAMMIIVSLSQLTQPQFRSLLKFFRGSGLFLNQVCLLPLAVFSLHFTLGLHLTPSLQSAV